MSWNYRLIRLKDDFSVDYIGIFEVYYGEDDNLIGRTSEPVYLLTYDGVEELREDLDHMLKAFNEPILTADDF